mmetsp:Transcript_34826/g.73488  ORF Transcript_34826/g.73488 Transcript_34826/m.73488 type:complete len:260 (+) Transcript_34826:645-1424(+)
MEAGDGKIAGFHFLLEPIDLAAGVAIDDCLGNGQGSVQITQSIQLPFLLVNGNVELFDPLKRQFILLYEDADGVTHEMFCHIQDIQWQCRGEKANLDRFREVLEDVINLVLEPKGKHFISFIQDEMAKVIQLQCVALDHVVHTAGGSDHHVHPSLKGTDVFANIGPANACMDFDAHVVTESSDYIFDLIGKLTVRRKDECLAFADIWVDRGKGADGKGPSFPSSRLSLCNHITSQHGRLDGPLLNGTGLLKSAGIDSTK